MAKQVVEVVRSNRLKRDGKSDMLFLDVKIGNIQLNGFRAGTSSKGTYLFEGSTRSQKVNAQGQAFENKHYVVDAETLAAIKEKAEELLKIQFQKFESFLTKNPLWILQIVEAKKLLAG